MVNSKACVETTTIPAFPHNHAPLPYSIFSQMPDWQEKLPPGDPFKEPQVQFQRIRTTLMITGRAACGTVFTMTGVSACLFGSELYGLQTLGGAIMAAAFLSGFGALVIVPAILFLSGVQEDADSQAAVAPLESQGPSSSSGAMPPPDTADG